MYLTYLIRKWTAGFHAGKRMAAAGLFATTLFSCGKLNLNPGNPAVLQVFNALDNGVALKTNLTGTHPIIYRMALNIYSQRSAKMNIHEIMQPVAFFGAADTLPANTAVWSSTLELLPGRIYSLFLFGTDKTAEHILIEDQVPGTGRNDSLLHLRFANMSNGQPVQVNLKGQAPGSLHNNLVFKSVSGFVDLPADKSVAEYEVEMRDAGSGALLATHLITGINNYQFGSNLSLNASITLVLAGQPGGTGANALSINRIEHF